MQAVAIIGAGPAGLAAAKYLKSEGFAPTVFEQAESVGGQWSGDPQYSGVWPSMRTNSSRVMTAFSDLRHEPDTPVYPSNQMMRAYLERYAERFDLMSCVRLKTQVLHLDRDREDEGWVIHSARDGEDPREERFARVVVATGRFRKARIPEVRGLESFSGAGGVSHAFHYKDPERYRGRRVLVGGGNISAFEIACELAGIGAARVIVASRGQRYVLNKIVAGIPADHLVINRYRTLANESCPRELCLARLKEFIVRTSGSPEQFGAQQPDPDIDKAGVTMSQNFLPLVAEGRIQTRPWMSAVDGKTVSFVGAGDEEVDAIIFGTGYEISLPFLGDYLRRQLGVDGKHLDLYKYTFHPHLPGLAFLGMMDLVGSVFPVLELQARWIAYVFSGARPTPSIQDMKAGVAAYRSRRGYSQELGTNHASLLFARAAGVDPDPAQWPHLARELLFGPLSAISFRLSGRDSLPQAAELIIEDARAFGLMPSSEFSGDERMNLRELAKARGDKAFGEFVNQVTLDQKIGDAGTVLEPAIGGGR
jgi:dimethylaniline monooxygenase (N-oxide forming)